MVPRETSGPGGLSYSTTLYKKAEGLKVKKQIKCCVKLDGDIFDIYYYAKSFKDEGKYFLIDFVPLLTCHTSRFSLKSLAQYRAEETIVTIHVVF